MRIENYIEDISKIEDVKKLESISKKYKKVIVKNVVISALLAIIGLTSISIGTSFGVKGIHEEVAMGMIVAGTLMGIPVGLFGDRAETIARKREDVKSKIRKLSPKDKDEYYYI